MDLKRIAGSLGNQLFRPLKLFHYRLRNPGRWFPRIIYFSVNSTCNMKCKMCDIGQKKKDVQFSKNLCFPQKIELPLSVFKKVIDEVSSYKPQIHIIATEPLLYGEILPASEYVKGKRLKLSITTNGYLLDQYAELFVEMELDDLWISLDGTRQLNDFIRGVSGSFDRIVKGIERIHDLKRKRKSQTPKIRINFTLSNFNDQHLVEFAKEMLDEKIDLIQFSHLNFVTEEMAKRHNDRFGSLYPSTPSSIDPVNPQQVNWKGLHQQIQEVMKLFPKKVSFVPPLLDPSSLYHYYLKPDLALGKKRCWVPWTTASIQPNGNMIILTRCFHYVLGNVHQQGFLEIWHGERYQSFRKALWKHHYFPACTRCCGIL